MKTLFLNKLLVVAALSSLSAIANAEAIKHIPVRCEVEMDSDLATLTLRGRKNYDQKFVKEFNLPITEAVDEQHVLFESEELNSYYSRRIIALGSASFDAITGKRKVFIGLYQYGGHINKMPETNSFYDLAFSEPLVRWDGQTISSDGYAMPIASAATDSNELEIFTGNYVQTKLNMKCQILDGHSEVAVLNPKANKEKFICNVLVHNQMRNKKIDELNKNVVLAFTDNERTHLQPIIEDSHANKILPTVSIMGQLTINPETTKPELTLGIYRTQRFYNPEKHKGYHTKMYQPRESKNPYFFSMPIAEAKTTSDYLEVRTAVGEFSGYNVKVECKKPNNQIKWSDQN